jgi:hypothetical protein
VGKQPEEFHCNRAAAHNPEPVETAQDTGRYGARGNRNGFIPGTVLGLILNMEMRH